MSHQTSLSRALCVVALVFSTLAAAAFETPPLFPAFPGAEGAGAYTAGGRGGQVLLVTTLADYDPRREKPIAGSLRAAVATPGPRIVLFRVAGYIELKADLDITHGRLTIAGQSAPGEGVCLKNASLKIQAPDVVIRYLRVRPGDVQKRELDCISSRDRRIIIDHCSASWGIDETISTNGNSADTTLQWSLIVESLNRSVHHKGSHGYGSLISGPGEITYHHNVYAWHRSRSPRGGDVLLDFRNNLVYGWGDRAGYSGNERLLMNYVGNYLRPLEYSKLKHQAFSPGGLEQKLYVADNYFHDVPQIERDNWLLVRPVNDSTSEQTRQALRAEHAFPTATVTTQAAADAYAAILEKVGASLPARDAVDRRVIDQIRTGTGRLIDSQEDVGGWPPLTTADPPDDTDRDGMPDAWEAATGLDAHKADPSSQDTDGDGYPDVEEFLNATDPRSAASPEPWIEPPVVASSRGDAFVGSTHVTLSTRTPDSQIHYTLDDSEPTLSSAKYSGPFTVAKTATLRAKTFVGQRGGHVRNVLLLQLPLREPEPGASVQPGLRYDYWEHQPTDDFSAISVQAPQKQGVVPTFDVAPRNREDDFGFRFKGLVQVPGDGIYTFTLRCSPRGRLRVGGDQVVEHQGSKREHSGRVALRRGLHPIELTIYFRSDVDKILEVDIEGPDLPRRRLGAEQLFHGGG
jgi:pectate lyase